MLPMIRFTFPIVAVLAIGCASQPAPPLAEFSDTVVERKMIGFIEKFDRWDENGDGLLTIDELGEAERVAGMPAREILAFYDTNRDGGISLAEAQAAYARSDDAERRVKQSRR